MTSNELRIQLNNTYGLGEWPKSIIVDHETYANVCQDIFDNVVDKKSGPWISITLGLNNGIMFKNVELILVK